MSLRVTQSMLNSNMLKNLSKSMGQMDKYQGQLSSGRIITRPSDDPVVASRGMLYRASLSENDQYQRNADEAQSWMEVTDNSLNEISSVLQRVRELVVNSGDGALSADSRYAMGEEVAQIKEQLGNIANQTIGSRYIFAGTDTSNPPYNQDTGVFENTNSSEFTLELSQQVTIPINVNPQKIFNYKGESGTADTIFDLLDDLATRLKNGEDVSAKVGELDDQMDNIVAERASLGARMNRIELIQERLSSAETTVTDLMSQNEDADIAEVITNLKTQENVHRAALGAGAQIIQPSLLDFLR
ncbi:flagellar hook-associated protein FlgL [Brevibacillus fulvus]|uniref:Flagellar hook-associated protein 3 FlgL n=1 Tax=Brevibacillus fulvus TaxID=1125967 RepID=A0A938Y1A0_9BACL|nr:flagellar hook-associated protein FlgL [Brevibacillus fulvus]MBM7591506.1 flagellar hook-associated protein 3 FlgL [Brevibacillus fulvus]